MEIHPSVTRGLQHHKAGQLREAELAYRSVLETDPNEPAALHLLGRVAAQVNRYDDAAILLRKALAVQPGEVVHYVVLAEILRGAGKNEESITILQRALEIAPLRADLRNSLGITYRQAQRIDEAIYNFQLAIRLRGDYGEAYSNLGNALRVAGRVEESLSAHENAVHFLPTSAEAHSNFGIALQEARHHDRAIAAYSRALELAPNMVEAMTSLGACFIVKGRVSEAVKQFERAAVLRPGAPEVQNNLGNILKETGRLDESIAAYRKALAARPNFVAALSNLGIGLSAQGKLDEAIELFRHAASASPEGWSYHSNLLYTLHFHPDSSPGSLLAEHQQWAARYAERLTEAAPPVQADRTPDRRLKIGYVSPDFRDHPVGRFLLPLLQSHDHSQFEIVCYSGVPNPDETTRRIAGLADQWIDATGLTDVALADRIRSDKIDILIDLTLHMGNSRPLVFARKPAPVQVTWLGYVSTTGMSAIDYRISDPWLDPPGESDQDYVEKTVRLPTCYWCYEPPRSEQPGEQPIGPLPLKSAGHVTFGSLNNFSKVSGEAIALWSKILTAIPNSRIIIHSLAGAHQEEVRAMFGAAGDRVEFVAFLPTHEYMALHNRIDIALDPFPYAGGTTTCDALWMGVPIVTLVGKTAVGRGGVSILHNVGLPELIAESEDAYLQIATKLAGDVEQLDRLRTTLRERLRRSPLMDSARFAREMESAYRQMWRNWCSAPTPR